MSHSFFTKENNESLFSIEENCESLLLWEESHQAGGEIVTSFFETTRFYGGDGGKGPAAQPSGHSDIQLSIENLRGADCAKVCRPIPHQEKNGFFSRSTLPRCIIADSSDACVLHRLTVREEMPNNKLALPIGSRGCTNTASPEPHYSTRWLCKLLAEDILHNVCFVVFVDATWFMFYIN